MSFQSSLSYTRVPSPPEGTEVASYKTYAEAQHAVDHLSDEQYNVRVLTIVGTDLRLVERITGRLTWGKVIWTGALSGLWFGLFMGVLFALWTANDALLVVLVGLVMGAIFGIILNVVPYAMRRGERDFTSATQVVASRYAVLATANVQEFQKVLRNSPGNLTLPPARPVQEDLSKPSPFGSRPHEQPRYGVRLTPEEREAQQRAMQQSEQHGQGAQTPQNAQPPTQQFGQNAGDRQAPAQQFGQNAGDRQAPEGPDQHPAQQPVQSDQQASENTPQGDSAPQNGEPGDTDK